MQHCVGGTSNGTCALSLGELFVTTERLQSKKVVKVFFLGGLLSFVKQAVLATLLESRKVFFIIIIKLLTEAVVWHLRGSGASAFLCWNICQEDLATVKAMARLQIEFKVPGCKRQFIARQIDSLPTKYLRSQLSLLYILNSKSKGKQGKIHLPNLPAVYETWHPR